MAMVAAEYDLLPNQIRHWKRDFHQGGYQALMPHLKGRLPKVKKKKRKALKKQVNKNEIERLKEELAQTKQELYDVKMDRDILKKIVGPVRTLKARQKTQIVDQIRADQAKLPKKQRYSVGKLLQRTSLSIATYYDERHR